MYPQMMNPSIKKTILTSIRIQLSECEYDYKNSKALSQYYWNKSDVTQPVKTHMHFAELNKHKKSCKEMLIRLTKLRSAIKTIKGM